MKNKVKTTIFILILLYIICMVTKVEGANILEGIENFPASYQPYLYELKKRYPNWNFSALYTNLDWKYVIDNENKFGKNLVPKSYSDEWKNTTPGQYNVEVDAGWVDCSRKTIEYAMDPRNFLNEVRLLQFETLSYDEKISNKDTIERILYGTEFYKRIVEYYDSAGNNITMQEKYSDLILKAGKTSLVSPYHLASRIKQEVGPFLSHSSISGKVQGYEGLYNFYNIGATSSSEPMGAIKNGLQYARDGKGASQATKDKYRIPWDTKERAITGGGIFIGSGYINLGQNTIYLQKFHVNDNQGGELFWHQYMTNVLAPYSEGKLIYQGYENSGILNSDISFIIPVYENMPSIPVDRPSILEKDFIKDNTKVYANVETTLNIRTGPSTSYEILTKVSKDEVMTRIAKGRQAGELWDKVQLENGMLGYVFQNYVKPVPEPVHIPVESIEFLLNEEIKMQIGESYLLRTNIMPKTATNKEVSFSTTNESIVTVNEKGEIVAKAEGVAEITVTTKDGNKQDTVKIKVLEPIAEGIVFDESLNIRGNEISGLSYENTVANLKEKITTEYEVIITDKNGNELEENSLVGTNSNIKFIDENNNVIYEFKVIFYGDVNGDGKINSVDLLVLQRHILEIERLGDIYVKAGNINKNGNAPSSLDLLLIQRHILQLASIQQ